jgi:hypothetical protein
VPGAVPRPFDPTGRGRSQLRVYGFLRRVFAGSDPVLSRVSGSAEGPFY